jgi:choline dehydrogenase
VRVLLIEAGGGDDSERITLASSYPITRFASLFWHFRVQSHPHLNGRRIPVVMGKALGGGSSVNTMVWARGHKSDFEAWAHEAGDPQWDYAHALARGA